MSVIVQNFLKLILAIVIFYFIQNIVAELFYVLGYGVGVLYYPLNWFSVNVVELKSWVYTLYVSLPVVFIVKLIYNNIVHRQSGG